MSSLTIKEILERTVEHFTRYQVPNPRLDAEVLLADLLGLERIHLYVRFDQPLIKDEVDRYRERVVLRSKRVPLQYITGHQEFMSLDFEVNKNVLIPRPETEHLVEAVMDFVKNVGWESPLLVDVGTGSGAIAISLAHYLPLARIIGVDISPNAVEVAKENARRHQVAERIKFVTGSFLIPLKDAGLKVDAIISNPPYITKQELPKLQPEVRHEPQLALDGGMDGVQAYRQIIQEAEVLKPQGLLAFEVGEKQGEQVAALMERDFDQITIIPDLAGIGRVVMGIKK